jgi:NAD(P)H dehydrogenase (quinone)
VILGSPTRFGLPAAQLKQFIDRTGPLWYEGRLAGKVYASFTATSTRHGGQESTLLALNNTFYHWGGFIVPPGYADPIQHVTGNPYGASHVAAKGAAPGEDELASARFLGRRVTEVAATLRAGVVAAA